MTALRGLVRYLLNINTIWGLLILSAFVLCVVQHYAPTRSVLSKQLLSEGDQTLAFHIGAKSADGDKVLRFTRTLRLADGALSVVEAPPAAAGETGDAPRISRITPYADAFVIHWDYPAQGDYALLLGDKPFADGTLVRLETFSEAALEYAETGFKIALGLVSTMVLFLGLMKVGENAGIVQLAARALHPIIRFLYPDVPRDHPANGAILMNATTTILGLGNAATPFGLKAMKELESLNPHPGVATNAQVMLLAYNTAGFAIIPTSLLAIRKSAGCSDPFEIVGPCMVAGGVSMVVAIAAAKLLGRLPVFSVQAALAEETPATPATAGTPSDQERRA
jgi:spore maturation protein A